MPELRIVDDDGAVHDDEGVEDVVILDELEEGLEAVPRGPYFMTSARVGDIGYPSKKAAISNEIS